MKVGRRPLSTYKKQKAKSRLKSIRHLFYRVVTSVTITVCITAGVAFGHEIGPPKEPIIIGGDNAYPPYEFIDPNGAPSGFNVELTKAIAEVMQMKVEFYLAPWSKVQEALREGKINAIQRISYSQERSRAFDFSPAHTIVHQAIFYRKDSPKLRSVEDLRDKEIIVRRGDIMHDYVLENKITDKVFPVESSADAFRLLASGEHDCVLAIKIVGLYWIDKLKLSNIAVGPAIIDQEYSYAVQHENAELLSDFAEGLAIIQHTGQYKVIYDKWLGVLEPHEIPLMMILKYVLIVLAPILALLIGSVVWSAVLKHKVAQRTAELRLEIAERKQAEESLRQSEERFQQVIENSQEWVWEVDSDGLYTYSSPIVESILGYEPQEIVGKKHFYDLFHPEDKEELNKKVFEIFAKRDSFHGLINRNIHKSGQTVWLSTSGVPVLDEQGNLSGYRGVDADITERKLTEKERERLIHEMEERLKELNCIFGISDLIATPGTSMNKIFQGTVNLIRAGWQYPEITCARITMDGEQYHTENFELTGWKQSSDIIVHNQPVGSIEVYYLEERPKRDEGPFLKEERGLLNAIAERLGLVCEQRQAEKALRESEEKFRLLAENIQEVFWISDPAFEKFLYVSPAVEEIWGRPVQLLLDDANAWLEAVHPDDRQHVENGMEILTHSRHDTEFRIVRPDGSFRWMYAKGFPVRNETGLVICITGIAEDITERKQAEEDIEMLAKFPSENPNPVIRISKDGALLYANTASDVLLSQCGCKVGTTVCEEWMEAVSEVLSKGSKKTIEREAGGRIFSVIVTPVLERGYVNLYGRDITERIRAEEAIENLRRQNEMILNSAGEGIFGLDCMGRHTFINPAAANMLGYGIDELLGQPSHAIWHYCKLDGGDYPEEQCPIYAAYRDGKIHRGDNEIFWRKDGSWFPVEYVSTPIRENGKLVGAVVVFGDITERKRIENELAESEQKYRDLYEYAPVGYHEIDTTGRIKRVNQTEAQLLGYKVSELVGKNKIDLVVPEQREMARAEMMKRFKTHWKWNTFDRKFVRKDGRVIDVHIQERPILDEAGKIIGIRSTVQDITERRRTEQDLMQMREDLESAERFAAAGQIAMQIAHEIGNPIALISGQIQHMIEQSQSRPEDLKAIIGHIDRISQLIKRFSELRKERPLRWSLEPVEPIIENTLNLLTYSRRFTKLKIKKDFDHKLPKLNLDRNKIAQVLLNLLLNASEACGQRGSITVSAKTRGEPGGGITESKEPRYVTISVEDTGHGIKEEDISRIFEPFYTTKPAGEGTGLGLPVSMSIAREHNGWIDVESTPGKGAKFTLWLPIKNITRNENQIRIEEFDSEHKKSARKPERRYK